MTFTSCLPTTCTLALALALPAQEDASTELQPDDVVLAACAKMKTLAGGAFSSFEAQDSAMMRRFRGRMPGGAGEIEVDGKWCSDVLQGSLNFGADEVVLHGGRMVARSDDGDWKPRHDTLATGAKLPFILDPVRFFEILSQQDCEVLRTENTTYRKQEMVIYSVTLTGDAAADFSLSGAVPTISAGGFVVSIGGGGGGGPSGIPETTIDLALYITPEDNLVHRIRIKEYQESNTPGNVQIQMAGMDNEEEEEEPEEVEELDAEGNRIYKKGMPVRELTDQLSAMEFDVRFKAHGKPFVADLDGASKRFLRLN